MKRIEDQMTPVIDLERLDTMFGLIAGDAYERIDDEVQHYVVSQGEVAFGLVHYDLLLGAFE